MSEIPVDQRLLKSLLEVFAPGLGCCGSLDDIAFELEEVDPPRDEIVGKQGQAKTEPWLIFDGQAPERVKIAGSCTLAEAMKDAGAEQADWLLLVKKSFRSPHLIFACSIRAYRL